MLSVFFKVPWCRKGLYNWAFHRAEPSSGKNLGILISVCGEDARWSMQNIPPATNALQEDALVYQLRNVCPGSWHQELLTLSSLASGYKEGAHQMNSNRRLVLGARPIRLGNVVLGSPAPVARKIWEHWSTNRANNVRRQKPATARFSTC